MGPSETSREPSEPSSDLYEPSDFVGLSHAPTEDHEEDSDVLMDESEDESEKDDNPVAGSLSTVSGAAEYMSKYVEGSLEEYYAGSTRLDLPKFLELPAEIWQQ
ncbi:hypothetical protein LTS18_013311, partial [Coniosporium uncinatum]